jgi:hypothetical protein
VIIVGHTRYKAAQKLGLEKMPVHVAKDLSPEKIKAYRIADNKTADLSLWDCELLSIELSALQGLDFDLELLGFSKEELAKIPGRDSNDVRVRRSPATLQPRRCESSDPTGRRPDRGKRQTGKLLSLPQSGESGEAWKSCAAEGDRSMFSAIVSSRNAPSRRKMDQSPTCERLPYSLSHQIGRGTSIAVVFVANNHFNFHRAWTFGPLTAHPACGGNARKRACQRLHNPIPPAATTSRC